MEAYTAEDFIKLIEIGRRDKISSHALGMIAKRFRELEEREAFLNALENAGVDNWSGYSMAYQEYINYEEDV